MFRFGVGQSVNYLTTDLGWCVAEFIPKLDCPCLSQHPKWTLKTYKLLVSVICCVYDIF